MTAHHFDNTVNLQKLEVFCKVVEYQSVTLAAEQLDISQPVVSAHLRSLERKLGVLLVRRVGRNIGLTVAGERIYKWAKEIITQTAEVERELTGADSDSSGSVVIAASMSAGSYILPPLIAGFYRSNPHGLIQTQISNPQLALDAVRNRACDFAVLILAPNQNLEGLKVTPLMEERLVLVRAPQSQWLSGSASASSLKNVPFISTSRSLVMRELEEGQLHANGVFERKVIIEIGHPEAQKHMVQSDLGVCFCLESSVRAELGRGELVAVTTPELNLSIPLFLVHRIEKEFSSFQRSLIDHFRLEMQQRQPA